MNSREARSHPNSQRGSDYGRPRLWDNDPPDGGRRANPASIRDGSLDDNRDYNRPGPHRSNDYPHPRGGRNISLSNDQVPPQSQSIRNSGSVDDFPQRYQPNMRNGPVKHSSSVQIPSSSGIDKEVCFIHEVRLLNINLTFCFEANSRGPSTRWLPTIDV